MIEDEDGKVRRNLVVFSTVILVVTFLGVQPMDLLKHLLGATQTPTQGWKAWCIALAVLFYLWCRFSYQPTDQELGGKGEKRLFSTMRPTFNRLLANFLRGRLSKCLDQDMRRALANHSSGKTRYFTSSPDDLFRSRPSQADGALQAVKRVEIKLKEPANNKTWSRSGDCEIDVIQHRRVEGKPDSELSTPHTVTYHIELFEWWWLKLIGSLKSVYFSQDAISVVFPNVLALTALLCVLGQLIRSIF